MLITIVIGDLKMGIAILYLDVKETIKFKLGMNKIENGIKILPYEMINYRIVIISPRIRSSIAGNYKNLDPLKVFNRQKK